MKKPYWALYATVVLDGMGMGVVMPILPRLLEHTGDAAGFGWRFAVFLSIYALMQFIFAPVLGSLGDRYGRRPVLLTALAGVTIDYLFMAMAPTFWLLLTGRAIAGIAGASISVASAYVADITPEHERAHRFGQLSACMGVGFIAGPVLGGVLGDVALHAPFLAAAALGGANLLLAWFALPEPPRGKDGASAHAQVEKDEPAHHPLNPLGPLRWLFQFRGVRGAMGMYAVMAMVGQVGGTIWVLYGQDKFAWNGMMVGLSLAGFGVFHALAQAFVVGPLTGRFGEKKALAIGIVCDSAAYLLLAAATRGWMAFALYPLFCLGGMAVPVLQAMLSAKVDERHQGRLQGILASLASLASIAAPLVFTPLYFMSRHSWPGMVWVLGASLYLFCIPLFWQRGGRARAADQAHTVNDAH